MRSRVGPAPPEGHSQAKIRTVAEFVGPRWRPQFSNRHPSWGNGDQRIHTHPDANAAERGGIGLRRRGRLCRLVADNTSYQYPPLLRNHPWPAKALSRGRRRPARAGAHRRNRARARHVPAYRAGAPLRGQAATRRGTRKRCGGTSTCLVARAVESVLSLPEAPARRRSRSSGGEGKGASARTLGRQAVDVGLWTRTPSSRAGGMAGAACVLPTGGGSRLCRHGGLR